MAATVLVMAPVIIVFFFAQKAFVEGVTLTGVKGDMKLAVVGGGSTYTPELVDGFARLRRHPAGRASWCWSTRRPTGSSWSAAWPGGSSPSRATRADRHHRRPRRGRRRMPTPCCSSCASAARRRATRTRPGRWSAAASARRPPGPAASPRRCAPCRSCWTSPSGCAVPARTPGSSTSPTRSGSSPGRCCQAGTGRVGLCNVAIGFQRRFAAHAGRRARPRCSLDHVGLNHLTWERARPASTASDLLPELLADHGDGDRRRPAAAAPAAATGSASSRRTTCATSTPTTRWCGSCGRSRRGPRRSPRSRSELLDAVRRPGAGREACAARPARRRLLLRGGRRAGAVAAAATAAAAVAGGQHAQRRHAAVPAGRRGDRGPGRVDADGARPAGRCAPLEPLYAGLIAARDGVRGPGPGRGAARRPRPGLPGAARPPAGRPGRRCADGAHRPAASRTTGSTCRGRDA